jgi:hypothetical protein
MRLNSCIISVAAVFVLLYMTLSMPATSWGYPFNPKSATLEETCVFLNTEPYAKDIDPVKVNRFRFLLDKLQARHTETRKQIGDLTSQAQGALKDYGVRETLQEIMESMNQVKADPRQGKGSYKELVTSYVTVRADGMTRSDAVKGLNQFFTGIAKTKRGL